MSLPFLECQFADTKININMPEIYFDQIYIIGNEEETFVDTLDAFIKKAVDTNVFISITLTGAQNISRSYCCLPNNTLEEISTTSCDLMVADLPLERCAHICVTVKSQVEKLYSNPKTTV